MQLVYKCPHLVVNNGADVFCPYMDEAYSRLKEFKIPNNGSLQITPKPFCPDGCKRNEMGEYICWEGKQ